MATINTALQNVNKLDLAREAMAVVKEMEFEILELNKDQLEYGRNKEDKLIKPKYKPSTLAKKLSIGRTGDVDLLDTGDFQRAMKLVVKSKTEYSIFSTDWKNDMLVGNYAKITPFFGLSPTSRTNLISEGFAEELATKVKAVTKFE